MAFPMEIKLVNKTENEVTVGFVGTDTTLIIPIIDELNKNDDVVIARFINTHPELKDTELYVRTKSGNPVDAIKKAADAVSEYFSSIQQ